MHALMTLAFRRRHPAAVRGHVLLAAAGSILLAPIAAQANDCSRIAGTWTWYTHGGTPSEMVIRPDGKATFPAYPLTGSWSVHCGGEVILVDHGPSTVHLKLSADGRSMTGEDPGADVKVTVTRRSPPPPTQAATPSPPLPPPPRPAATAQANTEVPGRVAAPAPVEADKRRPAARIDQKPKAQPAQAQPTARPAATQQQAAIQPAQPSAASDDSARRVALIVGNTNYRHVAALQNPGNDAQLLAETLRKVGFQSVTTLSDLTREKMIQALRDFALVADTADWAVVYYAGHGIEFGGANYLIPVDAQLKADRDIDLEAVDVGKILSAIESAKRLRLVILDACRDNPFASQMRRTVASRSIGRGLARVEPEAGTLIVYAAKHGEVALDGAGKNSAFAESLVRRISQRPSHEVRRLFDLVRDDVLEATRRKQQPFSYGSLSGREDFFFVR